jgi:hypothetical protein
VAEAVRVHATTLGWTHTETDERSGGEIQRWSRPEAKAAVYIRNSASADDGAIFVTHLASPMGRLIAGVLLGAAAGLLGSLVLPMVITRMRTQR